MGKKGIRVRSIDQLKELLCTAPLNIKRAYLFGSRARGDFLLTSDWDILIVSPDFGNIPFPDRATLFFEKLPLRRVELLCYTEEEFKKKSKEIGIVKEALKGKRLH